MGVNSLSAVAVYVLIIAHFAPLSTFFSKFAKVFRFGNSCALCARLPRQLRAPAWVCLGVCAGVCYARIKVRATLGGGLVCPRWARFVRPFSACFLGVGGLSLGVFWGGGVGERERQRRTGKGENAQRLTACGCPCACGCACRPCPCRLFLSVRQCYLFSVDNIAPMVGGILQPNGNRKTANSMCPLTLTPTFLSPNTEHIPFGRRFRKPSQ